MEIKEHEGSQRGKIEGPRASKAHLNKDIAVGSSTVALPRVETARKKFQAKLNTVCKVGASVKLSRSRGSGAALKMTSTMFDSSAPRARVETSARLLRHCTSVSRYGQASTKVGDTDMRACTPLRAILTNPARNKAGTSCSRLSWKGWRTGTQTVKVLTTLQDRGESN